VLVNMYGKPVFKYVPFRAFFQKMQSGANSDLFKMLIDIPGGRDYLFDYSMIKKDGTMLIYSGDTEFSTALDDMKDEKRKSKNFMYQASGSSALRTTLFDFFEND
jgi:hypothetical protein